MQNLFVRVGAIAAALAVVIGAFAAHGLGDVLKTKYAAMTNEMDGLEVPLTFKYVNDVKTAAQYQMVHAIGLIMVGLIQQQRRVRNMDPSRELNLGGGLFVLGTILFCGALYAIPLTGLKWIGAIAPIGGVAFIAGWLAIAYEVLGVRRESSAETPRPDEDFISQVM
jgi:uncharacterized membrane protein YgdD (TMEM256/DUF423 family)